MNTNARQPAVAGMFYPKDADTLHNTVQDFLKAAIPPSEHTAPKALIAPHAGYAFSGQTAAKAYALLSPATITRVILLGPAHRVYFRGLAVPDQKRIWSTPLGDVKISDRDIALLSEFRQVLRSDEAHETEHSLEVQLPFLQEHLDTFSLVPIAVGESKASEIAEVLEALWGGEETLILISSDLSHYEPYERAVAKDTATANAILDLNVRDLDRDTACGLLPIAGLVEVAKQKGLRVEQIDMCNSGDTAGPRDQVVGYGAFAFYEESP